MKETSYIITIRIPGDQVFLDEEVKDFLKCAIEDADDCPRMDVVRVTFVSTMDLVIP